MRRRDAHPPCPSRARARACRSYSVGARRPRTSVGSALWRAPGPLMDRGLRVGRDQLNATRGALGLPPADRLWGGLSRELCLVATFPQLEYPRRWPPETEVVGPLLWEPPFEGDAEPPPGDEPLVLVAPSTSQDPDHRLLRSALRGLADLPVRVLATTNRRPLREPPAVPGERARRRLALLRADDAALRRRRVPRRPRHRGARAGVGLRRRRDPLGRRHGGERGAHRLGATSASGCRGGCARRGRSGWRWAGRLRSPGCGGVRGRCPPGPRRTMRRCAPPGWWSGSREADGEGAGLPGPGSGGPGNLAR